MQINFYHSFPPLCRWQKGYLKENTCQISLSVASVLYRVKTTVFCGFTIKVLTVRSQHGTATSEKATCPASQFCWSLFSCQRSCERPSCKATAEVISQPPPAPTAYASSLTFRVQSLFSVPSQGFCPWAKLALRVLGASAAWPLALCRFPEYC